VAVPGTPTGPCAGAAVSLRRSCGARRGTSTDRAGNAYASDPAALAALAAPTRWLVLSEPVPPGAFGATGVASDVALDLSVSGLLACPALLRDLRELGQVQLGRAPQLRLRVAARLRTAGAAFADAHRAILALTEAGADAIHLEIQGSRERWTRLAARRAPHALRSRLTRA